MSVNVGVRNWHGWPSTTASGWPVHVYIVGAAHDLGDPRDLTQEFFARLLRGSMIHGADRTKGRFRSYLLGAVKHFLADMHDRRRAAKRGAQYEHITLAPDTDTSPGIDIPDRRLSDAWFDREWGLAVLALALETLAKEHTATDKNTHFHVLKPWLTGDANQADAAAQLGISEGAVKVAIHRLRKRFRECVKTEIAQTVAEAHV